MLLLQNTTKKKNSKVSRLCIYMHTKVKNSRFDRVVASVRDHLYYGIRSKARVRTDSR